MDLKDKNDPKAHNHICYLNSEDDDLSDHMTYQHLKEMIQERFNDNDITVDPPQKKCRLQLATIKPLYWDYLRVFYYVVKAGSFTKAQKYLCLSQSSISRIIQKLEVYLGEELLLRASSPANATITLTPAGWMVLEQVTQGIVFFTILDAHAKKNVRKD